MELKNATPCALCHIKRRCAVWPINARAIYWQKTINVAICLPCLWATLGEFLKSYLSQAKPADPAKTPKPAARQVTAPKHHRTR